MVSRYILLEMYCRKVVPSSVHLYVNPNFTKYLPFWLYYPFWAICWNLIMVAILDILSNICTLDTSIISHEFDMK